MQEKQRARRRRLTRTVASRRQRERKRMVVGQCDVCAGAIAPGRFKKRTPHGCGCSKRRKGRPRIAGGMCGVGARARIYRWRKEARELDAAVSGRRALDLDSDEIAVAASP